MMPIWLICSDPGCMNEVKVTPSKFARQKKFFCSRSCYLNFTRSLEGRKWNSNNLVGVSKMNSIYYYNNVNLYCGWIKWCERNKVELGDIVPMAV